MTRVYYKDTNACIIMFDLTQRSSFENACKWKKDLDAKCTLPDGRPVPCVLLANKVSISGSNSTTPPSDVNTKIVDNNQQQMLCNLNCGELTIICVYFVTARK